MILNIKETAKKELAGKFPEWAINGIIERYEENHLVDENFTPNVSHAEYGFSVLTVDDCMDKFKFGLNDADYELCDDKDDCIHEYLIEELGNKVVATYDDPTEGKLYLIEDY